MNEALGLSIGTANLVAARPGRPPVSRRSVLTIFGDRPAEVGVPSQNPDLTGPNLAQSGLVLRGFVERVGDPVPLVAADGSSYLGTSLTAMAVEALVRTVDDGTAPAIVVAAPAHWGPATVGALRAAMRTGPALSPAGVPPTIVSEATAALAALQAQPGLPNRGAVALCDFGASGSSITLVDAGAGLTPIGETLRFADFSGDLVDRALLNHVLAGATAAGLVDQAATAAVGSLVRLTSDCRSAKERLSAETTTVLTTDLPGYRTEVRITRDELDALIAEPLTAFLDALGDILERNRIPAANVSAVATVGGGAAMPAITQRLAETLRVPVITTATPWATAAVGTTLLAGTGPDAPTGLAPTAADSPTGLAPSAWASGAPSEGSPSSTFRALAWSEDDDAGKEPVPYLGEDYQTPPPQTSPRPMTEFEQQDPSAGSAFAEAPLPWYRRPPLLFGIAAAVAALAVGGLTLTLTSGDSTPTTTTTRVTKPGEPAESTSVAPQTITVTGGNGETTVTTVTPPPTSSPSSSEETTTTTTPTTTTTATTTTTTTTTTPTTTRTTTSRTTTTQTPTTTTSAAPPPTTTTAPKPTTTAAPPTTTVAEGPTTQAEIPTQPGTPAPVETPAQAGTAAPVETPAQAGTAAPVETPVQAGTPASVGTPSLEPASAEE